MVFQGFRENHAATGAKNIKCRQTIRVPPDSKCAWCVGDTTALEYFAIVRIPEGSTLEDVGTGKRLDSTRALLIFPRGGYVYMLGYASGLTGDDSVEAFAIEARKSLDGFRSTIVFR